MEHGALPLMGAARPPAVEVDRELALTWGRFKLTIVHNPGKTTCALIVDDEEDDLLLCGDAIVGNIVYISSSAPDQWERCNGIE